MQDRGRNQNRTVSQYIHIEFSVVITERWTTLRYSICSQAALNATNLQHT
jgi:hypothetical protein